MAAPYNKLKHVETHSTKKQIITRILKMRLFQVLFCVTINLDILRDYHGVSRRCTTRWAQYDTWHLRYWMEL